MHGLTTATRALGASLRHQEGSQAQRFLGASLRLLQGSQAHPSRPPNESRHIIASPPHLLHRLVRFGPVQATPPCCDHPTQQLNGLVLLLVRLPSDNPIISLFSVLLRCWGTALPCRPSHSAAEVGLLWLPSANLANYICSCFAVLQGAQPS
jgi:hypothetical protein